MEQICISIDNLQTNPYQYILIIILICILVLLNLSELYNSNIEKKNIYKKKMTTEYQRCCAVQNTRSSELKSNGITKKNPIMLH